jgi:pyruvate,water dikinase
MATEVIEGEARPTPIPQPLTFPVAWATDADADLLWMQDRMHFPDQQSVLDAWYVNEHMYGGFNAAAETYQLPIRVRTARFNTWHYMASAPLHLSADEGAQLAAQAEANLGAAMGRLDEQWINEYLPEIESIYAKWDSFNLETANVPALLAHLEDAIGWQDRLFEIHFLIAFPMLMAPSMFADLYRDLFPDDGPLAPYGLLAGLDNRTLQLGRALYRLSRVALRSPDVRAILETEAAGDVIPALERSAEGRAFVLALDDWIGQYGRRSQIWNLRAPSWTEDPTPVIKSLKDYVTQPERDPDAELAALAGERERAIASARERLALYPEQIQGQFEFFLRVAQHANVLSEDHNDWIDFGSQFRTRRLMLAIGRRMADANMLDDASDIFHLTPGEVRSTLTSMPAADQRALVAARKAELDQWATIAPPPFVGSEPPCPPPDNPLFNAFGKFFGGPPPQSSQPGILRGAAGSPGVVRGPARIVRSLAEADKIQTGDILVAETTAPPWTPLFATVAAVVTDTGGVLSHCAVVAREYRIPAVIGTGQATRILTDGQIIEVDGDRGEVRIVE